MWDRRPSRYQYLDVCFIYHILTSEKILYSKDSLWNSLQSYDLIRGFTILEWTSARSTMLAPMEYVTVTRFLDLRSRIPMNSTMTVMKQPRGLCSRAAPSIFAMIWGDLRLANGLITSGMSISWKSSWARLSGYVQAQDLEKRSWKTTRWRMFGRQLSRLVEAMQMMSTFVIQLSSEYRRLGGYWPVAWLMFQVTCSSRSKAVPWPFCLSMPQDLARLFSQDFKYPRSSVGRTSGKPTPRA